MSKEEKRAVLLDWLAWALANRVQDDFMCGSSVAFMLAKLESLR